MKILAFTDRLDVGGTQVNAVELAAALRDQHGHEVIVFATPGPMAPLAKEKGLRLLTAPDSKQHPSPTRIQALREVVRKECPDIVHAWDFTQCLDAYYGVYLPMRVPLVVTIMSMTLPRVLPKSIPTTFGTPELMDQALAAGRRPVDLVLPPVDVHKNAPEAVDPNSFRNQYNIQAGEMTVVTVSRLVQWMKAESLHRTIDSVRKLARALPLRLIIVGDGPARAKLEQMAREVNTELRRSVVVLTGALIDPRPAYAAADLVVGMGGSALRAMAFGKPVIVVGERGFSAPFTPETAAHFYYKGMYGIGDGDDDNIQLTQNIASMSSHSLSRRQDLGSFSREFILQHFSLDNVSARFSNFCQTALESATPRHVALADSFRTASVLLRDRVVPNSLWRRPGAWKERLFR